MGDEHSLGFTVHMNDPMPPQYFVRVVSDTWLGSEVLMPVSFWHLVQPEQFPALTELLDMQVGSE
jgi:hypothetical protein